VKNIRTYKNIVWVDLESPTPEEARELVETRNIHPAVAEELLAPTARPKVDLYDNAIYLILHFPSADNAKDQEIDFVVGKNFLITARYNDNPDFHQFSKLFEVNSILERGTMGEHAGFVLFFMLRHIYRSLLDRLSKISSDIAVIEKEIFAGREKEMVFALSKAARDLLNFKRSIRLHKDILSSLEAAGENFFGGDFSHYLRGLTSEYFKVESALSNDLDTVFELRETNNSLVSTKQNEDMRALTVIALIALPLTLLASLLQIDTVSRPIIGIQGDFWIVLGLMAGLATILYILFKKKRWL